MDSHNGDDAPIQSSQGASAETNEMDFSTWIETHKLDPEIVTCLKDEEMTNIKVLKEFPEEEISSLELKPEHQAALSIALHSLRVGNETTEDDELATWAAQKEITEETVQKLKDGGIKDLDSLKRASLDDFKTCKIKAGQRTILKTGIAELKAKPTVENNSSSKETSSKKKLPDMDIAVNDPPPAYSPPEEPLPVNEFVTYLSGKKINNETIRKLMIKEYDSLETLHLIDEKEVDEMQLSKPQKHLLLLIIKEANTEKETKQFTYGQAFEQLLKDISLDATTIDKLTKFGMDSPEALTLLDKDNLDIMQLPPAQRVILEDAIDKLKTIDEVPEGTCEKQKEKPQQINAEKIPLQPLQPVQPSTSKSAKHGILKEEKQQDGFFGALGRWTKTTAGKAKSGLANAVTYLKSAGTKTKANKIKIKNGMRIVKLPVKRGFEDEQGKVRKCIIGNPDLKKKQKTIMVVGATGAGKSTLIDGLCNYIFDTKWEESNRFQLIDEHEEEEKNAAKGQAMSQTEWITIYTINSGESNRLPYTLNLIDTPGFGDTRGITRDQRLVEQIRSLFKNRGQHDIDEIDAVCFVAKAPDARLTPTQRYIFNSILSVFGKDIEGNILVMITFADGAKAPVLEAINAAALPYRRAFPFNNSALFANNGIDVDPKSMQGSSVDHNDVTTTFGKMFWDMGIQSFKTFFDFLGTLKPKSLSLTSEVLEQRQNLKDALSHLETKVRVGLSTMDTLKQEEKLFKDNENRIKDNEDFKYTVTKHYSVKIDCPPGRNVTHCLICHETCHANCGYRDDDQKANCVAMDYSTGKCRRCKLNCHWTEHKNTGYYLEYRTEEVEQTLDNKLKEYQEATGIVAEKADIIKLTKAQYAKCEAEVRDYVKRCRDILQRIREIALKPDPLSETEYIEELIKTEKDEHKDGWQQRVEQLEKFKKEAETIQKVHKDEKLLTTV